MNFTPRSKWYRRVTAKEVELVLSKLAHFSDGRCSAVENMWAELKFYRTQESANPKSRSK